MNKYLGIRMVIVVVVSFFSSLIILELAMRVAELMIVKSYVIEQDKNLSFASYEFRIVLLGESTTAEILNTWPAKLQDKLSNVDSSKKFRVINLGRLGENSAFIVARLDKIIQIYKPHLVVTMMGINDNQLYFKYSENVQSRFSLFLTGLRIYNLYDRFQLLRQVASETSLLQEVDLIPNETLLEHADAAVKEGQIGYAKSLYERHIRYMPEDYVGYLQLGKLYSLRGSAFNNAETVLSKAYELAPTNLEVLLELANMYLKNGDLPNSRKFYRAAAEVDPTNIHAVLGMAMVSSIEHKKVEALKLYEQSKAIAKDEHELIVLHGADIFVNLGMRDEAIHILEEIIDTHGMSYDVGMKLASIYGSLSLYAKQEETLLTIRQNIGSNVGIEEMLRDLYIVTDRNDLAIKTASEALEKILEMDRDMLNIRNKRQNMQIEISGQKDITKHHYLLLHSKLNESSIPLIAMQYPLVPIEELYDMFPDGKDTTTVLFLSNEENFQQALLQFDYNDLFVDRFGGVFGHTTPRGDELIADNLAEIILGEFNTPI